MEELGGQLSSCLLLPARRLLPPCPDLQPPGRSPAELRIPDSYSSKPSSTSATFPPLISYFAISSYVSRIDVTTRLLSIVPSRRAPTFANCSLFYVSRAARPPASRRCRLLPGYPALCLHSSTQPSPKIAVHFRLLRRWNLALRFRSHRRADDALIAWMLTRDGRRPISSQASTSTGTTIAATASP